MKGMINRDWQWDRRILQIVFGMPASKQSCPSWANQVNTLNTRSMVRPGPGSGDSVLVVVDYFSRNYEIEIMCSTTSAEIIKSLERILMIHVLPLSVTSDNRPFERYLEGCGIEHTKTIPLWPQANGEVERQNQLFWKGCRLHKSRGNRRRKKFANTW